MCDTQALLVNCKKKDAFSPFLTDAASSCLQHQESAQQAINTAEVWAVSGCST